MKKFLLQQPANAAWVRAQEARQRETRDLRDGLKIMRASLFPELTPRTIETVATLSEPDILHVARHRQRMRDVMKQLRAIIPPWGGRRRSSRGGSSAHCRATSYASVV